MSKFLFQLIIAVFILGTPILVSAQSIESSEESFGFSNGSHPALIVTIPFGNEAIAQKEVRSLLKEWDGKYDSGKDEYLTIQATLKSMGGKPFDVYCRIFQANEENLKIAVAVDLGGAYMNRREHKSQYEAMEEKFKKYAYKVSIESIEEELNKQAKVLRKLEKERDEHISNVASSKKNIEEYKDRIKQAEQRITENEAGTEKKKGEIEEQQKKIEGIADRKKRLK